MAEKVQTIKEIHQLISQKFKGLYPPSEALSLATITIEEYTGKGRARQITEGGEQITESQMELIIDASDRIAGGEPLQYVLGYTIFCGNRFDLSPAVLIPRPETEELTAMIIEENKKFRGTVIDYCTGSGCIAISLSRAFPNADVHATDISAEALDIARRNALSNNAKVTFHQGNILDMQPSEYIEADIIVSNPPYVRESEKCFMRPNVLEHEPGTALFVPDEDPLRFYSKLSDVAALSLKKNGRIYLEINEGLGKETAGLFHESSFTNVTVLKDISGRDRFIKAEKNEGTEK